MKALATPETMCVLASSPKDTAFPVNQRVTRKQLYSTCLPYCTVYGSNNSSHVMSSQNSHHARVHKMLLKLCFMLRKGLDASIFLNYTRDSTIASPYNRTWKTRYSLPWDSQERNHKNCNFLSGNNHFSSAVF